MSVSGAFEETTYDRKPLHHTNTHPKVVSSSPSIDEQVRLKLKH